jgi:NADH-quinone oxidoreductase subunit J
MLLYGALGVALLALFALLGACSAHPLETFTFYTFAATMVGSSLAIVLTRNIVRAATWLLGTLGAAAGLYLLLSANFIAAIQLIVYAGGILVLIVFGVMLTASNPFAKFTPSRGEVLVTTVAMLVLLASLLAVMFAGPWPDLKTHPTAKVAEMRSLGEVLLTDYLVPFEAVSVLLLAVMIGAAYLARPVKK